MRLFDFEQKHLYHTTSLDALYDILDGKSLKPYDFDAFISFSSKPLGPHSDIRGKDATLVFTPKQMQNQLMEVIYDEAWLVDHPEHAAYVAGEGWREQFIADDWVDFDDFEDEDEAMQSAYDAALLNAFETKHGEREWVSKEQGEPINFTNDELSGIIVHDRLSDEDINMLRRKLQQINPTATLTLK